MNWLNTLPDAHSKPSNPAHTAPQTRPKDPSHLRMTHTKRNKTAQKPQNTPSRTAFPHKPTIHKPYIADSR